MPDPDTIRERIENSSPAMTGEELAEARLRLGMSVYDLARALRLGDDGARFIRRMEKGSKPVSGPVSVAVDLMLRYGTLPDFD